MTEPIEYDKSNELTATMRTTKDSQQRQETGMEPRDVPVVLLMTYMRSGSTLLGDIVQQLPNVLYSYEPLKHYLAKGDYLSRDRGTCYTTNDTCRNLLENKYQFIIDNVKHYFKCDSQNLDSVFLRHHKSESWLQLCAHKPKDERKQCISEVVRSCKSAVRIIKTIRLSMDVVQELMEDIPYLKVIHLLRDPRGMIVSRQRYIGHLQYKQENVSQIAEAVCDRYDRDISIGQSLKDKFPNRIKTVLYEQIAQRPLETSIQIFKFLGLQPKSNFNTWLRNHTTGDPKMSLGHPAFNTVRVNSTATSNSWRLELSLDKVIDIDRKCSRVYKYTGYLAVKESSILKNLDISVREEKSDFP